MLEYTGQKTYPELICLKDLVEAKPNDKTKTSPVMISYEIQNELPRTLL
jgi:hypothetical protein